MDKPKIPICLHFHIFKNAGTTIDWTLKKNFSENALNFDDIQNPGRIFSWNEVLEHLKKFPHAQSLSSHQIRFPLPKSTEYNFIPLVFIRNPIDRAFSIYFFKRTCNDSDISTIKAKTLSLDKFIEWYLENKKYQIIKNFQVLFLSRNDVRAKIKLNDYKIALENIVKCPILGIVERIDESLILAEEVLRPYFKEIDLAYIKQNISQDTQKNLLQRLAERRLDIGDKLMDQLVEFNKFDEKLYNDVNNILDQRLNAMEKVDKKLSNFQKRCNNLVACQ